MRHKGGKGIAKPIISTQTPPRNQECALAMTDEWYVRILVISILICMLICALIDLFAIYVKCAMIARVACRFMQSWVPWYSMTIQTRHKVHLLGVLVLKLEYSRQTRTMPWLMMAWLFASPFNLHILIKAESRHFDIISASWTDKHISILHAHFQVIIASLGASTPLHHREKYSLISI